MITELLKEENCILLDKVSGWEDAIRVACKPLIEQGYCTNEYVDAIFESTEKYGPYYVLCENLALIHAGNEKGVNGTQLAVTVLKEPVKFTPDGYDVRILICLVAKDSSSHMEGIKAISNIFADNTEVAKLLQATSPKEVYNRFIESV